MTVLAFLIKQRRLARKAVIMFIRRHEIARFIHRQMIDVARDVPGLAAFNKKPVVRFDDSIGPKSDVRFEFRDGSIVVSMHWLIGWDPERPLWEHICAPYFWFAHCPVGTAPMVANVSDGDHPSHGGFANSAFLPDVTLLPDHHFFKYRGYDHAGKVYARANSNWSERSDKIVWRGGATGNGYLSMAIDMAENPAVNQRVRLAQKAKNSEIDFKFVKSSMSSDLHEYTRMAGLLGDEIDQDSWVNRKYAIDIDGFSNAWSNLFIRLKLGCCVLKVDSLFGYRQWYYDKLLPYEHYVPIKADLSDLFEQVDWVRNNQEKAEKIAAAGRALVDSMSFASETAEAVRRITAKGNLR